MQLSVPCLGMRVFLMLEGGWLVHVANGASVNRLADQNARSPALDSPVSLSIVHMLGVLGASFPTDSWQFHFYQRGSHLVRHLSWRFWCVRLLAWCPFVQSWGIGLFLRLSPPCLPAKVLMELWVHASYGFAVHDYSAIHKVEILFYVMGHKTVKLFRKAACVNNYDFK